MYQDYCDQHVLFPNVWLGLFSHYKPLDINDKHNVLSVNDESCDLSTYQLEQMISCKHCICDVAPHCCGSVRTNILV